MKDKPLLFIVVEDHPEVAQNNCDFLRKFDPSAVCIIANTPQEALQRIQIETPDLIVLYLQFVSPSDSQSAKSFLELLELIFNAYSSLNILTALPAIMQYSFPLAPLLSQLSALRMYLIAAVSAVYIVVNRVG
ncbi:MAG: hypothetical protein V7K38_09515 [Nostoc sp.]|uniref:hypothetical protein n=1 Tax=Nostoc sp. TaxID=1180 RepID=UPI002FF6E70A